MDSESIDSFYAAWNNDLLYFILYFTPSLKYRTHNLAFYDIPDHLLFTFRGPINRFAPGLGLTNLAPIAPCPTSMRRDIYTL